MAINVKNRRAIGLRINADLQQTPELIEPTIKAALMYRRRRDRRETPPGKWDKAGRFSCSEPFNRYVRSPSRAFPLSALKAAVTAGHCAFLHDADETIVRKLAGVLDAFDFDYYEPVAVVAIWLAMLRRLTMSDPGCLVSMQGVIDDIRARVEFDSAAVSLGRMLIAA